jgi:hypothetical protein
MGQLTIRTDDELHQRITQAAEQDRRSINQEMLWLLEAGLMNRDQVRAAAPRATVRRKGDN